jgi:hypothetical protein
MMIIGTLAKKIKDECLHLLDLFVVCCIIHIEVENANQQPGPT